MINAHSSHSENVRNLLAKLDGDRAALLQVFHGRMVRVGAPIFPLDFLAAGAVKRAVSAISAFKLLTESWNMTSARTMLRTHLDTGLRFSAAWLVENPHTFASDVIAGGRIDKMKDRHGRRLTDAQLVEVRSTDYPWLPAVYAQLSGYIHFSGSHVSASIESVKDDDQQLSFVIAERDTNFPESSWVEVLESFREATGMLLSYMEGYALTKELTPAQLEAGRAKFFNGAPPA